MRSINNSIDTPSIKLKMNQKERIDEMKTTKTIKKSTIIDKKKNILGILCLYFIHISFRNYYISSK